MSTGMELRAFNVDRPAPETYEQQMKDSDTVFNIISIGDFDDYQQAERAVMALFFVDMSFSRSGISHALKRLEKFYANKERG